MEDHTKVNLFLAGATIAMVWVGFSLWDGLSTDKRTPEQKQQMIERLKEQNKEIIAAQTTGIVEKKIDTWWEAVVEAEPITVNLKLMPDYHDKLASYAYDHCKTRFAKAPRPTKKNWYDYSCKTLVKVWQAENGWWNKDVKWVTHDGGICQLNPKYHSPFIHSPWYQNPLAQIEYCQWVWEDAARRWLMPWFAYDNTKERSDPYIEFIQ